MRWCDVQVVKYNQWGYGFTAGCMRQHVRCPVRWEIPDISKTFLTPPSRFEGGVSIHLLKNVLFPTWACRLVLIVIVLYYNKYLYFCICSYDRCKVRRYIVSHLLTALNCLTYEFSQPWPHAKYATHRLRQFRPRLAICLESSPWEYSSKAQSHRSSSELKRRSSPFGRRGCSFNIGLVVAGYHSSSGQGHHTANVSNHSLLPQCKVPDLMKPPWSHPEPRPDSTAICLNEPCLLLFNWQQRKSQSSRAVLELHSSIYLGSKNVSPRREATRSVRNPIFASSHA